MKKFILFLTLFCINPVLSQHGHTTILGADYGTRNRLSDTNSFKYGIIGSNQDATGSPVGLVSAIIRRVPSARKVSDRFGNASVSLRGRNSVQAAGDEVLWDIDGVTYITPPMLSVNDVVYVEIVKGLSANNRYQIWIPKGCAHGFLVLTKKAELQYKTTDYYKPEFERTIMWNDKTLNIKWPLNKFKPILSLKDSKGMDFKSSKYF